MPFFMLLRRDRVHVRVSFVGYVVHMLILDSCILYVLSVLVFLF